jgi:hypothetical protein
MVRAGPEQRPALPAWAVQLYTAFATMVAHCERGERCWLCGCGDARPPLTSEALLTELGRGVCENAAGHLRWLRLREPPWAADGCCAWCAAVTEEAD